MLFQRRDKPGWLETIRVWMWPRRTWARSYSYFTKRILRLTGSPHTIAAGVAAGVAASCTPFVGFHFIVSFIFAFFVGGNMLAAALGTSFGNPLSFPFIWATTWKIGNFILGGVPSDGGSGAPATLSFDMIWNSFESAIPVLKPMLVGSIPFGFSMGLVVYIIVRFAAQAYQRARSEKLRIRRKVLQDQETEQP
ncbi:DUF2062 domain-containing protein [Coralliovum pocilloporae]|uniref:DUF2062 domain-containing protein n=1 Tax=Coralliovum pocilloporae TaxID=3066369 RepID=UPI00330782A9